MKLDFNICRNLPTGTRFTRTHTVTVNNNKERVVITVSPLGSKSSLELNIDPLGNIIDNKVLISNSNEQKTIAATEIPGILEQLKKQIEEAFGNNSQSNTPKFLKNVWGFILNK